MVVEKLIHVTTTRLESCLIHFLCTYPTLQGRGYAKRLMAVVFSQPDMMNKKIYAVTRLPEGYEPIDVIKTEEDRVLFEKFAFYSDMNKIFFEKMFFTGYKNSSRMTVDECNPFIYGLSATMVGNTVSVRIECNKTTTSVLYELDSRTKS